MTSRGTVSTNKTGKARCSLHRERSRKEQRQKVWLPGSVPLRPQGNDIGGSQDSTGAAAPGQTLGVRDEETRSEA